MVDWQLITLFRFNTYKENIATTLNALYLTCTCDINIYEDGGKRLWWSNNGIQCAISEAKGTMRSLIHIQKCMYVDFIREKKYISHLKEFFFYLFYIWIYLYIYVCVYMYICMYLLYLCVSVYILVDIL